VRRADRLFRILQVLRRRRTAITAAVLAERLEVSERTIYRDVRDLISSGTPIEGEAGVGYRLGADFDLPPLMFEGTEIEAVVLGARIVASLGDEDLRRASRSALEKIAGVLPERLQPRLAQTHLFAARVLDGESTYVQLACLRHAMKERHRVALRYRDQDGRPSERVVRPLGAFYWGRQWTLSAWCELREDFRSFRVDRIEAAHELADTFAEEPGRTLVDYLAGLGPSALAVLGDTEP
jgi:predicted DNA-binding transcriptional regulator YafY